MRTGISLLVLLLAAAPVHAGTLKVMTYNILHGQPCSGGSQGGEVDARMALAVAGGPNGEPGLAALEPDILGMQEVSQVLVTQSVADSQACLVLDALGELPFGIGGVPDGVTEVTAYEHQGDQIVRRLNGALASAGSPYKMRFMRDNPRLVPLTPDVPLPPDEKTLSDHSTEMGNIEIGLAVVSKLRIQQVTVHNLTVGQVPGETRAILHATLRDATGKPYDFYDSHLTTTGGNSPQTIAMAAEIARFIRTTRRHSENPGFFTCDCNATPDEAVHDVFTGAGFVDSYAASGAPEAPTSGREGLSSSCSQPLDGRIDYVWALPDANGDTPTVLSSQVVMHYNAPHPDFPGDPTKCLWPSDHDGVITTFQID